MNVALVRPVAVALAWAVAAAPGYAGLGSVISSFSVGVSYSEEVSSIYRDAAYVYVIQYDLTNLHLTRIRKFTPSGSYGGLSTPLASYTSYGDADHSALGEDYIGINCNGMTVQDIDLANGSVVSSWSPLPRIGGYAYIPGGGRKYVSVYGTVYCYTKAGSFVNSFRPPRGSSSIGATDVFKGKSGEYITVMFGPGTSVYNGTGKLVGSFRLPSLVYDNLGGVCGPGYPASCGTTFWFLGSTSYDVRIWQISLGNGVPVEPTSVGRIKALFR